MSIFAGALVLVSFKISHLPINYKAWLCAITVVAIACATMVQNDWRDRVQDVKRGKRLAHDNPRKFFIFLLVMWTIAIAFSLVIIFMNNKLGLLALLMITSGLLYSETRKIVLAPILFVCVTGASSVLFPVFAGYNSFQTWLLFLAIFAVVFGREISNDLKDVFADKNYKWTLPQKLGTYYSKIIAGISVILGLMMAVIISPKALIGLPLIIVAVFKMIKQSDQEAFRLFLDIGMALSIIAIVN